MMKHTADSVALIRLSGTSAYNNKANQVRGCCASWHGNQSSFEQQQLAAKVAEFLKPGVTVKHTKEGTESSAFWFALEEKQSYTSKKVTPEVSRIPTCLLIHLIKQTPKKSRALDIGQKYVEMAASLEGLSPNVPLYKVTEGNGASASLQHFSYGILAKLVPMENSFQKKVMLLFGVGHASENQQRSNGAGGPTQRASALAALNSAFSSPSPPKSSSAPRPAGASQASQRAALIAALSNVLTAEKKQSRRGSPVQSNRSSPVRSSRSSPVRSVDSGPAESDLSTAEVQDSDKASEPKEIVEPRAETNVLKAKSDNPVTGIDFKEAYLSDEEFMSVLGMKEAFYKLPKWKQDMHKRKVDLF
ncbi:hypothetical protein HAX54_030407 [Datura stramonium]|uniref:HP domain-containing protein n=1 Tax=Datura stramonium TaxID=4076 RepID=A0ABS8V8B7_DATST|nr:hypothetical protein [Datura stramonium]